MVTNQKGGPPALCETGTYIYIDLSFKSAKEKSEAAAKARAEKRQVEAGHQ